MSVGLFDGSSSSAGTLPLSLLSPSQIHPSILSFCTFTLTPHLWNLYNGPLFPFVSSHLVAVDIPFIYPTDSRLIVIHFNLFFVKKTDTFFPPAPYLDTDC